MNTTIISESAVSQAPAQSTADPDAKELWFVPLFNSGDLDGLMAHFDPDTVLVTEPDAIVAGFENVREVFREIMWNKLTMTGKTIRIVRSSDLALLYFDWTLQEYGSTQVNAEGTAMVVLRRRNDGKWLVAIYDPFSLGAAISDLWGTSLAISRGLQALWEEPWTAQERQQAGTWPLSMREMSGQS